MNKVRLYKNGIQNILTNDEIEIEEFLELLKQDNKLVQEIRKSKNKEERDKLKLKLYYVTFSGTFKKRAIKDLKEASGLVCLDYDDLEDLDKTKQELIKDKYTHCLFESPSGNGLKLIVKIPIVKNNEEYKQYWNSLSKHFKGIKVDKGTKDISRACFLSTDKNYYFNPNSEFYMDKLEEDNENTDLLPDKVSESVSLEVKETDTSPSGKEFGEVCRLIKKKKTKEQIWEEMKAFIRWSGKPESYKERTYKEALTKVKNEKKKILTSLYVSEKENLIVEQIYDKENGSRFCAWDDNKQEFKITDNFKAGKVRYYPQEGEEIEKGAIILPSNALDYVDDKTLDKKILNFIHKWLDVSPEDEQFILWNTKKSWVYQQFHTLNYLRALGDTGLGKSRYLDTAGYIHYKSIKTTGSSTPAPLFRIIDKWRGSLIMDEADLRQSDEADQIIKILNQGFEKNNFIMRCDGDDKNKINFFDPYCPKILATRKSFLDKATESRCITHVLTVTDRKDMPLNLNEDFFKEALKIRNMLLMWRFKNYFKIDKTLTYDFGDIEPRVKQIVSSYVSLFSHNKEKMEQFKEYITKYQEDLVAERQSSFEGAIVEAIHSLLEEGKSHFTTGDVVLKGEFTGSGGKTLHSRALTNPLKSLGFGKPLSTKIEKKTYRLIPLEQKHIDKVFVRYGFDKIEIPKDLVVESEKPGANPQQKSDKNDDERMEYAEQNDD